MKKAPTERHYSGPSSKRFWRRVNALKSDNAHGSLYTAGVILQELEARVLQWLVNEEESQRALKPRGRGKV